MRTLFITWDGPQVNYAESLFLPIFTGLAARGYPFDILQFRWGDPAQELRIRERCAAAGIGYRARTIWRGGGGLGPFATALTGAYVIRAAARHFGSELLLPRSHMPALATLCARLSLPILFDADGLPADERVEFAGLSANGITYRLLRDIEAQLVRRAAAVITRSSSASGILMARAGPPIEPAKFHVVANGRDPLLFNPGCAADRRNIRLQLGIGADAPLLVYSGSIGEQYRFDLVAKLLANIGRYRPDARLLMLTGSPDVAQTTLQSLGVDLNAVMIVRAKPEEVPNYLAAADVGLAYRTASFSMQAVAPVKIAEYLLCGLPVIGSAEIGDTSAPQAAGVFYDDGEGGGQAARWFLEKLSVRDAMRTEARRIGLEKFSLDRSLAEYENALRYARLQS